jgi:hypothetical protein
VEPDEDALPTDGGSNVGRWEHLYSGLKPDHPLYGDSTTYKLGGEWLDGCKTVADWGCGLQNARHYILGEYIPLDGSRSGHEDTIIVDLAEYRGESEGIFMRHVLEHDYRWAKILDNALDSFTKRMALILFTPMAESTREIGFTEEMPCPDLSFSMEDILGPVRERKIAVRHENMPTGTWYHEETIFYLEKP